MIFWTHLPVRKWLLVENVDPYHPHPWAVRNGAFIVARCSKQSEAERIVRDVELAFAKAIARDILNEETTNMTDLKKLIENAGKKFAEDVVAAIRATQVGDLLDEAKTMDPVSVIHKLSEVVPVSVTSGPSHRRKKVVGAKPPKTKAQTREGQVVHWCKRISDDRATAIMPDASVRSFGRSRDLVYRLRKEGYTVLPLQLDNLTDEQRTAWRVAMD